MKYAIYIYLFVNSFVFSSLSQTFGNEWIDYNQPYYIIKIVRDGIYRIPYAALSQSGIDVENIDPSHYRIYGKEREIPIRIVSGGDNNFEFIEFYAQKNDGWLDSLLYDNPGSIGNPAYSLYNDTLQYFLTWKPGNSKRFVEETDVNFSSYTPSNYVIKQSEVNYNTDYHVGFVSSQLTSSFFVPGESWGSKNFNFETRQISVNTESPYLGSDAPPVEFHGKSNANSNATHQGDGNHHLRWEVGSSNQLLYDEVFIGYRQTIVNETFSPNLLESPNTNITFRIVNDQGAATDFQSIHYLYLKYAKQPNLNGQSSGDFWVKNNPSQAKIRLDIENANLTNPKCFVMGGGVSRVIPMQQNSGIWQLLIPNAVNNNDQRIIIASNSDVRTINNLTPVNGNGFFTNYNNYNFEQAYIMVFNKKLSQATNQYANYRSSPAGGSFNVITLDVDELYLQFGGGINKHILGIRRALHFAYSNTVEKPVALFLIGKGIREANEPNTSTGDGARKNFTSYAGSLIPSYGYPSSDICITARFDDSKSWYPAVPTGRIAAKTNSELIGYLNKIQVYEAQQSPDDVYNKPNKAWQKQVLHFGGGQTSDEHQTFRNYLNNYKKIIEREKFGGIVTSYFKDNTNPFNPVLSSEVKGYLERGVSLMTFFGHASATGFDQNIDEPDNWGNSGKYPIVLGNSCFNGDIFQPTHVSASERFVLIENLGAIAFMSSIKLAYGPPLNQYSFELYRQMSSKNYGQPLAVQAQKTVEHVQGNLSSLMMETATTQNALHGDPAMKLNWHILPEIDLTEQDIYFEPSTFDITTDSVEMYVVLTNLGKSITEGFGLDIRRNFPSSNVDSLYHFEINELHYKDTFMVKFPVQPEIGVGMNSFNVQADIPSFIDEVYDEYGNNEVTVNLFIDIDGIAPVLPYNYAVVPNDSVVLKASTINPIANYNTYRFEIDTTDLFNSPFRRYAIVSGLGGVKEVFPDEWRMVNSNSLAPLVLEDSMAYFWRVAVDSTTPIWTEYSFQHIKGKEGWGQDHFYQFKNGGFTGIEYNRPSRKREFKPIDFTLECDVHDNASTTITRSSTLWKLNAQIIDYAFCTTAPSLHVAVVDPVTLEPWGTYYQGENEDHQFGNVNNGNSCRDNRVEYIFIFRQSSASQLQAFENMINNEVPDGHFLLIYTARYAQYDNWEIYNPNLFNVMQNLGSDSIQVGRDNRAFAFFVKKGDPSTVKEVYAQTNGEFINLTTDFSIIDNRGLERSTIIGPAAKWHTLYWKQDPIEVPNFDKTTLSIRALNASQTMAMQIDTLLTRNDSIINLNNIIPAENYPYLQLQASYRDTVNFTPAQLDRWHVLYETLPEAAIDGTNQYTWRPMSEDSLKEGQDISFAVDVKNISHLDMDSLLIKYWVVDNNQNIHPIEYERQDSLRVGEVLRDTLKFNTKGMVGLNMLNMEVNPYLPSTNNTIKDQPELAHFNNILQLPFRIGDDDINPILDVTFDGIHILNGDIINPNAEIVITLKDNNPFLIMKEDADTSLFGIYLTDPSGTQRRVPFIDGNGQQVMQWIPADGDNLKFKIIYPARFTEEGEYELLVQGSDKSGNISGDLEYRVKFDVILASTITHMMNYPNPFSTKTRFVFTLTGTEVPDELIIQIMTVTGRVVREITQDELGLIRIGRNISEYAWDGRDEFGDQLANGVYLYRVNARINGETIDHRSSGADQHFKRNWGKMYLMR